MLLLFLSSGVLAETSETSVSVEYLTGSYFGQEIISGEWGDKAVIPAITAMFSFNSHWTITSEYAQSDSFSAKPRDPENFYDGSFIMIKSKRDATGIRYTFDNGAFLDLGYYNHNVEKIMEGLEILFKTNGLRYGFGYRHDFKGTPWTVTGEYGIGANDETRIVFPMFGEDLRLSARQRDARIAIDYSFNKNISGRVGYRYIHTQYDPNITIFKINGILIGTQYKI